MKFNNIELQWLEGSLDTLLDYIEEDISFMNLTYILLFHKFSNSRMKRKDFDNYIEKLVRFGEIDDHECSQLIKSDLLNYVG